MRRRIDAFINHPIVDFAIVLLILSSVALLIVETTIAESSPVFGWVEFVGQILTGVFVAELVLRFYSMPSRRRFLRNYWLDIFAVMPVMRSFRILRVLRLLRLFRMGILVNRRISFLGDAFRQGKNELLSVFVVVLIVVLAGAIGMNLVERDVNKSFEGIEDSTWWSLYTLVSGEPVLGEPRTFVGRLLALVVMLGGLGFFAMFTGIISASMVNRLSRRMEVREMALEDLREHVIMCGWSRVGLRVIEEILLDEQLCSKPIVLIAELEGLPDLGPLRARADWLYFVHGDFTKVDVLKRAGVERAGIAILLADETGKRSDQDRDARTVLAALTIEKLNARIFSCVELLNRDNRQHLSMAGVEEIVVPGDYAGRIIAACSRTRGLVSIFDELLTSKFGNQIYKSALPADWARQPVGWIHAKLKEEFNAVLLSIEKPDGQMHVNPKASRIVQPDDQLVFIAEFFPKELGLPARELCDQ